MIWENKKIITHASVRFADEDLWRTQKQLVEI